ncbi:ABC transporter substrate-binding protein [Dactylosporangium sp. CA-052675]|uniref:ABC transporter substrate-binding protein n=1 Tax=Dactylosporangium sp. CA-052675 TaxID=3239927 RepID=UPI003D915327
MRTCRRVIDRAIPALSLIAALSVSGCGSTPEANPAVGNTLTVVTASPPQTLDPAKTAQNNSWLENLAYEPLIVRRSDGTLTPGLAESWSYEGTGNKTFVLKLRPGVTFSDGSPLSAQNVVDHLKYVVSSAGQMAPLLAGCTFTATDPATVTITSPAPNPDFPVMLTQDYIIGGVIGSGGLADPGALGTTTVGAGPYMLDAQQTVAGDHYTYVPNPHYYNAPAVRWRKVVIRVITTPQAVLNALKTGQADVAVGDPSTVGAAKQAGLTVASSLFLWNGVVLADRGGTLAKPLGDARVRQALNFATDRAAIAKALFPGAGEPAHQVSVPGGYGYDDSLATAYPYQVDKAKALLAEAGYGGGFTLALVTPEYQQLHLMAQALAQQWKQIGVDLRITDYANANQYSADAFGGKFPAFMTAFGQIPIWMEGPSLFLPSAAFNPLKYADPALQSRYDAAASSTGETKNAADRGVVAYLTTQAWFVPVVMTGLPYYARNTVGGIATSPKEPLLSLYEIVPAA